MAQILTERQKLYTRWGTLKQERSSWLAHWKEISTYISPRQGRFFTSDRDRGNKRHNAIYDNTGTRAARILAAGMQSGASSPARPWFRIQAADKDLRKSANVKAWCFVVTQLILDVFARSNTYRALHSMYGELGAFGTAASFVADDFDNVIHHHTLTAGQYAIAVNGKGVVDTMYREFDNTVAQLVGQFGYDACSVAVRNLYDRCSYDSWVTVIHAVEPRADRDYTKRDGPNKPFKSVYFESGANGSETLANEGFDKFPVLAPRWDVSGGDIYGNSPGMEALGDIKQLQHEQLRKAEAIDYMTKPPLQAPTSFKNMDTRMLPGGISFVDTASPSGGIKSAFDVNLNLQHLLEDIQDVRTRVNASFYVDMFLMISQEDQADVTATAVAEKHEEKLLMLGPVLERLHNEELQPAVEDVFDRLLKAGALPPPPQELQGQELQIYFISILAEAQRAVETNSVDRFVGSLGAVSQYKPDVLDKFDADEWADAYSDLLGVDPKLIIPSDKVAVIRQQRARAQAQAAKTAQVEQQASAAQKLAGAPTQGGASNALQDVMGNLTGY